MKKVLTATLLVVATACGTDEGPVTDAFDPGSTSVVVSSVLRATADHSWPARVVAGSQAPIATRIAGRITWMAELGARVSAGDVLIQIEDADVQGAVSQAEAALDLAQRTSERMRALHSDGAASDQELDEAESRRLQAEGAVAAARAQLGYTRVTAPFAGTVSRRLVEPGALTLPGQAVLQLSGGGHELRLDLAAEARGAVQPGTVGRLPDGREVQVLRAGASLDPSTRRFAVETTAPAGLVPGALVEVAFPGASADGATGNSVWLPADAVVVRGQLTGVFTIESDVLRLRWVRLGRTQGEAVELLAGPDGLDRVVRNPGAELREGMSISTATPMEFSLGGGDER